jgi:YD repeat-containing protein
MASKMKLRSSFVYLFAIVTTTALVKTLAPATTLTVLQRFDFPSQNNHRVPTAATLPQKFSDQGDIIGTVVDVDGTSKGFIYKYRLGKFSQAFSEPNDTGHNTQGRGINNLRHSCGEYLNASDGTFHGYLLKHPSFFDFNVPGATNTIPLGINNNGSFVGTVALNDGTQPAFVSLVQTITLFSVPGATATFAYQLNDSNEIIGYYIDANGITHGFTRDSAGNLTFPIDVAGSAGTILFGNNSLNWGVGRYTDASGATHGLYYITPDNIMSFDAPFPGAVFTSLNGINRGGQVCGYYIDAGGTAHGLVAQLDPNATPSPTPTTTPRATATPTP